MEGFEGLVEGQWSDRFGGFVVKVTENWALGVVPMIFNDRVVIASPREIGRCYTAGWCYDKGGAAGLAAMAFDPETDQRPVGFKKEAYDAR